MPTSRFAVVALATLLLSIGPSPARAFDATGTWVGKWSCKDFDGQKGTDGNAESTLLITQTGTAMAIDLDAGFYRYNGNAIPDGAKPEKGEAALLSCAIDDQPLTGALSELMRFAFKTKSGSVKATLKGVSIFQLGAVVGTCKYSFKRTSDVDPNVSACPA